MKRFSVQFKKEAEKINLSEKEQAILREKMLSFMEFHPLDAKTNKKTKRVGNFINSEEWTIINLKKLHVLRWSGLALVLTLTTIPYLAESAIPGDPLYAVKVNFNEEVRSTLTFNTYDKIVWETERLNRRIAEINLLTNEGKMTEKIEDGLAEAVKNHRDRAKKEIESLKQSDKDGAILMTAQFDAVIGIQSTNLKKVAETDLKSSYVSSKVVKILDEETESKKDFYDKTSISWDRLVTQVEKETKRAFESLKLVEKNISKKDQASLKRRLETISQKINIASEKKESADEEAKKMLIEVLVDTQKLIILMLNSGDKTNLDLEEIIPVILTREERLAEIEKKIKTSEDLLEKLTKISEQSPTEEENLPEEIREKIAEAIKLAKIGQEEIKPLLAEEEVNLDEVEKKNNDTLQILKDATDLVKNNSPAFNFEEGVEIISPEDEEIKEDKNASSSEDEIEGEQATSTEQGISKEESEEDSETETKTEEKEGKEIVKDREN